MSIHTPPDQTAFPCRAVEGPTALARETAGRVAQQLSVDETHTIDMALHATAARLLAQYEPDDGPLKSAQLRLIKDRVPQGKKCSIRSNL